MAEEPILGLFDGDTNFLDELVGTGPSELSAGISAGGMLQSHLHSNTQAPQGMMIASQQGSPTTISTSYQMGMGDNSAYGSLQSSQQTMIAQSQQQVNIVPQAQQPGGMIGPDSQQSMSNQVAPQNMMGASHQQYGSDQFGQYHSGSMVKMSHTQGVMMGSGVQQTPFNANMSGCLMSPQSSQPQQVYPGYNMVSHQSQTIAQINPQQQPVGQMNQPSLQQVNPMMSPNSSWNQAQTSPTQPSQPHSQFMPTSVAQGQMSPYMNQSYHPQHMSHYNSGNKVAAPNSSYMPSPNPMQTGMTSPPAPVNIMGQMQPRGSHGPTCYQVAPVSQQSPMMPTSYNQTMNQAMPHSTNSQYGGEILPGSVVLNPANTGGPVGHHYPPYSGGQQPGPPHPSASLQDSTSHFQSSPTSVYCPPYPTMAQPRASTSTPPPQPTPPPPNPLTGNQTASQGNYVQSSLQQLEQLVSPGISTSNISGSNPYQQLMQQNSTCSQGVIGQQGSMYSASSLPQTTIVSSTSMAQAMPNQAGNSISTSQSHMNMQGQMGHMQQPFSQGQQTALPAGGTVSPSHNLVPQSQTSLEIQRLEKQLQQLISMPHNQQVSQQMLDVQERLRFLRSQHQLFHQQQSAQVCQPGVRGKGRQQPQSILASPGAQSGQVPQIRPLHAGAPLMQQSMQGLQMQSQPYGIVSNQGMMQHPVPGQVASMQHSIPSPQKVQPFQSPSSTSQIDSSHQKTLTTVTIQPADSLTKDPMPGYSDNLQICEGYKIPLLNHSNPGVDKFSSSSEVIDNASKVLCGVMAAESMPTTITEIAEAQEGQGEKPKRKRQRKPKNEKLTEPRLEGEQQTSKEKKPRKPRTPKEPKIPKEPKPPKEPKLPKESKPLKEPKPRKPRTPKEPKEPILSKELKQQKEPKPKAPRVRKRKTKTEAVTLTSATFEVESSQLNLKLSDGNLSKATTGVIGPDSSLDVGTDPGQKASEPPTDTDGLVEKVKTPKSRKPRAPKTLKLKPKKKKAISSLLFKGIKRKRKGSVSDTEIDLGEETGEVDPNVEKRRSSRNTKRTKYVDDIDLNLSDDDKDENETTDAPVAMKKESEEDTLLIDKVLGERIRKFEPEPEENQKEETKSGKIEVAEEEFFVKYKNYSYLHCEWKTLAELERGDRRVLSKIKRFRMKKAQSYYEELDEEELFNPDYVEVDRVLDISVTKDPESENETTHYLVKWRALSYEEASWELDQDVDPKKVEMFMKFKEPPPEDQRKVFARPTARQWKQIEESPVYKNDNTLREYQLEGVNWLTFCWYNGRNCILADEMGLGKTIQSITFLNEIYKYGIQGPFLVIVPLSTIGNWQREFETWTDMNVVVYHGSAISRNMIKEYELFYKDEKGLRIPDIYRFEAVITTFEILLTDVELFADIEWRCCIIDEAHRLKNKNCRLLEGLRLVDLEHRVLLTGTPLQNNTEELYSLLNFLSPNKFNSSESFIKDFGDLKTEEQVDSLKEILKPMMLRRLKEDVEKNLAPKEETIIEVELTNIQKKYYRAILERNFQFLSKGTAGNVPSLMNTMMELRKCCNHPFLINGAEEKILEEAREKNPSDPDMFLTTLVQSCGKMVLMDKLLPRLKSSGHKVLIFSQMIRVLDIIEDYLIQKKYLYERLDGRIRGTVRQEAIDRFSKPDSDRFAFLLCTRAGGLGINLTAADTVVIYDSDWNPQNDLQAQARCHRIGQSKAVKVYRLITRNSYEREMFDKASLKLGLDKAVLQSIGEKPVNPASQLSKKEIEDLLKKGAYGALMEDDSAGDSFCEEDIDQILQRRTKVIQIESEGKGSTFAKASFTMTDNRNDIDIDDPEFWQKWAKKADIDTEVNKKQSELIIAEPRRRRQVNRYGNDDTTMEISDLDTSSGSEDDNGLKQPKKRKHRGRGKLDEDSDYGNDIPGDKYDRSECFKVEKLLLVYGWGRWSDLLKHAHFKRRLNEDDVIMIARAVLAHSLKYYKGDEKIKEFIWDLISSGKDGELKNHSGLSAPVPRGRKGKKRKENLNFLGEQEKPLDFDPEKVLDNGYKKHLHRHSNKVLLRVRLLYYIKQELIGENAEKVFQNVPHSEIDIPQPILEGEVPAPWWDEEADKSLIIGVFKYGYEKFNSIRSDPALCFLSRCGPPDGAALLAEQEDDRDDDDKDDKIDDLMKEDLDEDGSNQSSVKPSHFAMLEREVSNSKEEVSKKKDETDIAGEDSKDDDKLPFPDASLLNVRLRKCITNYQRHYKKRMLKNEQLQRRLERKELRNEYSFKEREFRKREIQQTSRWTRREESDFYRTVSTFGVEFSRAAGRFRWDRFREQARLEKKHDDSLTEYFHAFYFMCQRVCGKLKPNDLPPNMIFVEPITEERASRCLARIDLLNKIRQDILMHPELDDRVKLCQPSYDMPGWWICGQHDKELLIGAARHGVAKTDFNILRDKTLSFHLVLETSLRTLRSQPGRLTSFQEPPQLEDCSTSIHKVKLPVSPVLTKNSRLDERTSLKVLKEEKAYLEKEASGSCTSGGKEENLLVEKEEKALNSKENGSSDNMVTCIGVKEETSKEEEDDNLEKIVQSNGKTHELKRQDDIEQRKIVELASSPKTQTSNNHYQEQVLVLFGTDDHERSEKNIGKNNGQDEKEKGLCGTAKPELSDQIKVQLCLQQISSEKNKSVDSKSPDEPRLSEDESSKNIYLEKEQRKSCENQDLTGQVMVDESRKENLTTEVEVGKGGLEPFVSDLNAEKRSDIQEMPTLEPVDSRPCHFENKEQKTEKEDESLKKADKKETNTKNDIVTNELTVDSHGPKAFEVKDEEGDKPDYVKLKEKIIQTEIERIAEERLQKERQAMQSEAGSVLTSRGYPVSIDGSCVMEVEGLEPGEIAPTRYFGPAVEWPKDRVIFHRLEHICYTVENGEWPFSRRASQSFLPPGTPTTDSRSETPVSTLVKSDSATGADSDQSDCLPPSTSEFLNSKQVMMGSLLDEESLDQDFLSHLTQERNDNLKMTFHKRGRGKKRKYEIDPDKVDRIQQLLNQSANLSSDDSQSESMGPPGSASSSVSHTPQRHLPASPLVSSSPSASSPLSVPQLPSQIEQGMFIPERKRRGRKPRSEKMAELALVEALAKREHARILSMMDPDVHIPVINIENGSILTGDAAPTKQELESWMLKNPGYMIDKSICHLEVVSQKATQSNSLHSTSMTQSSSKVTAEEEIPVPQFALNTEETFVRRRGRKPQLDPRTLHLDKLTGNENVAVVERGSGKKITGAKAPPLKHLKEWLDQNASFDVESKWGDLVRGKGVLPKSMEHRILKPSGRGRKPRDHGLMHSHLMSSDVTFPPTSLSTLSAFQSAAAAGLVSNFHKLPIGLPFGAMASLPGLTNPLLGLQGLGLPGLGFPPHLAKAMEEEIKERAKESENEGNTGLADKVGEDNSKEEKRDKPSSTSGIKDPTLDTAHPSFPHLFFSPMLYNPILAAAASGGLANFALPTSIAGLLPSGIMVPPQTSNSSLNGQIDSAASEEDNHSSTKHHFHYEHQHHHGKRKKHHAEYQSSSSMTRKTLTSSPKSSLCIPHAHIGENLAVRSSKSSQPSVSYQAQDLSLRRCSEESDHSSPVQDCATDLSIKYKDSELENDSSSSKISLSSLKVQNKNKIQGSLKLNRILDSLKDRVMKSDTKEKNEKKSEEPKV